MKMVNYILREPLL